MKQKALVFYTYLPPWRIDVFNEMGKYYDLTIIFLNPNTEGFTYNRDILTNKLTVDYIFWDKGFNIGSKAFRFGILKLLRRYKPSVVFSHEYSPTSILVSLCLLLRLFNFELVITTSDNLKMAQSVSGVKALARKFVLSRAHGIVVYSQVVKEWYRKHFIDLSIEVCPNIQSSKSLLSYSSDFPAIIPSYLERYKLGRNNILFVGRLVEEKGLDLLIRAFAKSEHDDYKLIVVGEGGQKEAFVSLVKALNISDKVIFPGYFDGAKLYAWYALSRFFVLPSRYEPFGAVVNEALVFGCPVLASKYIGALDYINANENGMIFDPLNEDEFIATLDKAMNVYRNFNVDKNSLMSCSFEEYVESFKRIAISNDED